MEIANFMYVKNGQTDGQRPPMRSTRTAWAAPEGEGQGRDSCHPCPSTCPVPQENFFALWALYYPKVWLIKRHFCKQSHLWVFFAIRIIKKRTNLRLPLLKVFQLQGVSPLWPLHQGLCRGPRYVVLMHTTTEWRSAFNPHTKKLLPPPPLFAP